MFLRNCWYVAAFSQEVEAGRPFARTLLDQPVVLYRTASGAPVAFEDACCHRALPLSLGTVVGDNLRCGYHGLVFEPGGACIQVPGQTAIPPGARVRAFPLVERYGWIWIWMGDPECADPAALPDWRWLESDGWRAIQGRGGAPLHVACNYELISDNLFDITHLSYVHATTIGTDAIVDFPCRTERLDRSVRMTRLVMDRPAAPFYQWAGEFQGNVDRWLISTIDMPCHIVNHAGCVDTGTDMREGHRQAGVEMKVLNAPTPETAATTHYFYAHARSFRLDDPEADRVFRDDFTRVFLEDKTVLEAQQAAMSRAPAATLVDINADAPGIQVRRLLRELVAAEAGAAAPGRAGAAR